MHMTEARWVLRGWSTSFFQNQQNTHDIQTVDVCMHTVILQCLWCHWHLIGNSICLHLWVPRLLLLVQCFFLNIIARTTAWIFLSGPIPGTWISSYQKAEEVNTTTWLDIRRCKVKPLFLRPNYLISICRWAVVYSDSWTTWVQSKLVVSQDELNTKATWMRSTSQLKTKGEKIDLNLWSGPFIFHTLPLDSDHIITLLQNPVT